MSESDDTAQRTAAELAAARVRFAEGISVRWVRIGGHNIDLAATPIASTLEPWRDVEPTPPATFPTGSLTHEEGIALGAQVRAALDAAPAVECCAACGRPLIGVSG